MTHYVPVGKELEAQGCVVDLRQRRINLRRMSAKLRLYFACGVLTDYLPSGWFEN